MSKNPIKLVNDIDNIYLFDTLHDFWKERKTVNNDEEDDDDEPLDENKMYSLRFYLVEFMYKFINIDLNKKKLDQNNLSNYINDLLKLLTNQNVTSVTSKYERSILKYYEQKSAISSSLFIDTKESITYGDIIHDWEKWIKNGKSGKLPSLWIKYQNAYGINNILEISPGDDTEYDSFGIVQQKNKEEIIGNFILNYMFPEFTLKTNIAYITFDAKTGVVGKVFRDMDNVFNLITPANISDSAPTSFKALNNRNEYIFPSKTNNFIFDSNFYTKKNNVKIQFNNNKFSDTNPYGFNLNINNYDIPFSATQKQGPSVNYLVDLILQNKNAKPKNSNIIKINSLLDNNKTAVNQGLLLDLKRTGDYEQVNSAIEVRDTLNRPFVLFSTIDILCSLYARIKKQNNMLHVGESITLFRFPKNFKVNEKEQELQIFKYNCIKILQALTILQKFNDKNVFKDIENIGKQFESFLNNGVFIDKTSRKKSENLSYIEQVTTIIIKLRIIDINKKLDMLKIDIANIATNVNYNSDISILKKCIEDINNNKIKTKDSKIETLVGKYKNIPQNDFIQTLSSSFDLTPNQIKLLNEGENVLGFNYECYIINKNVIKFKYNGECKSLHFSNKLFSDIFDIFNKFDRIVNAKSAREREKKLYEKLHQMNYFSLVNNLHTSFFDVNDVTDSNIASNLYNILQPENTSDDAVKKWYVELSKKLMEELESNLKLKQNSKITTFTGGVLSEKSQNSNTSKNRNSRIGKRSTKKSSPTIVKYVNADTAQCRDLSDLLRNISGIAASFIESILTNDSNYNNLVSDLNREYFNSVKNTLEKIEFVWLDGIMTIQNNMTDEYIYKPTESEYIILYLLSAYYDTKQNQNVFDHEMIDMNRDYYNIFENRTSRMGVNRLNDLANIIQTTNIPAEIIILILFTMIDNTMQEQDNIDYKEGFFYNIIESKVPSNFFDNKKTWSQLPDYFYSYLTYITTGIIPPFQLFTGGKYK